MKKNPQGTSIVVRFEENVTVSGRTGNVVSVFVESPSKRDNCRNRGGIIDEEMICTCRSPLRAMCDGGTDTSIPGMFSSET